MRRQALGRRASRPTGARRDARPLLLRPRRRADAGRRPRGGERGVAREAVRARAPSRPRPLPGRHRPARRACEKIMIPGMGGRAAALALNSLLVVMDGIDDPPLIKRVHHQPPQHVPRRAVRRPAQGRQAAAAPAAAASRARRRSTSSAPPTCRWSALDPALVRPGRMGRHVYFRTPDVGGPARHLRPLPRQGRPRARSSTRRERRDELARITNGYSPAMIDQVCSMALTYAHADGRERFAWKDLVEAMTVVEAGVAVGQPYRQARGALDRHPRGRPRRLRHLYNENLLSTRLSIRRRGDSGGHHQAMRIEDRFVSWRSEEVGRPHPHARRDGGRATSSTGRTRPASAATCAR